MKNMKNMKIYENNIKKIQQQIKYNKEIIVLSSVGEATSLILLVNSPAMYQYTMPSSVFFAVMMARRAIKNASLKRKIRR